MVLEDSTRTVEIRSIIATDDEAEAVFEKAAKEGWTMTGRWRSGDGETRAQFYKIIGGK